MGCGGSKKMEPEGRYKASKLFFEEQPYTEDNEPHVDHQVFQFYDEGVNHGDPQNSDPHLKDPVCQQAWLDPACQQLNLQARAFVDFRSIAGGFSIEKTCIKLKDGWLPSLNQVLERLPKVPLRPKFCKSEECTYRYLKYSWLKADNCRGLTFR